MVNVGRSTMKLGKCGYADCGVTAGVLQGDCGVLQGDYEVTAWTPTNRVSSQYVLLFLLVFCLFFYPVIIITISVLEEI